MQNDVPTLSTKLLGSSPITDFVVLCPIGSPVTPNSDNVCTVILWNENAHTHDTIIALVNVSNHAFSFLDMIVHNSLSREELAQLPDEWYRICERLCRATREYLSRLKLTLKWLAKIDW